MAGYTIVRHPHYEEICVAGDVNLAVVREILVELTRSDDFLRRHAMWHFGMGARPLAFHEFDDVIGLLEKIYARGPANGKRVALVARGSFARSVAEIFVAQAGRLPVTLQIFDEADPARDWLEG